MHEVRFSRVSEMHCPNACALYPVLYPAFVLSKSVAIIAGIILVTRGAKLIRIRRVETGAQSARPSQPLPAQRAPA